MFDFLCDSPFFYLALKQTQKRQYIGLINVVVVHSHTEHSHKEHSHKESSFEDFLCDSPFFYLAQKQTQKIQYIGLFNVGGNFLCDSQFFYLAFIWFSVHSTFTFFRISLVVMHLVINCIFNHLMQMVPPHIPYPSHLQVR